MIKEKDLPQNRRSPVFFVPHKMSLWVIIFIWTGIFSLVARLIHIFLKLGA